MTSRPHSKAAEIADRWERTLLSDAQAADLLYVYAANLEEQLEAEGFTLEALRNGCEQALLLLDRDRFEDDPEAKVVRAVLRSALGSNPASGSES